MVSVSAKKVKKKFHACVPLSISWLVIEQQMKNFRSSLSIFDRFDKAIKPPHATVPLNTVLVSPIYAT